MSATGSSTPGLHRPGVAVGDRRRTIKIMAAPANTKARDLGGHAAAMKADWTTRRELRSGVATWRLVEKVSL